MRIAVVIPTWNRSADTARCLRALAAVRYRDRFTIVVAGGLPAAERAALDAEVAKHADAAVVTLGENRGFAGGVNAGLEAAFARGAAAVLVLNDDAVVDADLLDTMVDATCAESAAGILAPRVVDDASGREVSRGERVHVALLCLPRTWLRVRRGASTPYRVSGVLGVAFLVTRACFEAVGPLTDVFFAYYEEVDYCLRARRAGFAIVVVPMAQVRHRGFRGFAGGFTPLAAYLKTRNLPLLARRHAGPVAWALFLPTYLGLVLASVLTYVLRGNWRVVSALARGLTDAIRARTGPPPVTVVGSP